MYVVLINQIINNVYTIGLVSYVVVSAAAL